MLALHATHCHIFVVFRCFGDSMKVTCNERSESMKPEAEARLRWILPKIAEPMVTFSLLRS